MYTSPQLGSSSASSGIGGKSLDALRVQLFKMNSQQLQAFAMANQDDAVKLGLAAEADKVHKQHTQEQMALMSGQQPQPPVAQQILQSIGQPPQQPQHPMPPQGMPPQGMPPQGQGPMPPQGMPPQGPMPPQGMPPQGHANGGYMMPEDQGIATLPVGNMDFAQGGIIAFGNGGDVPGYAGGTFTGPGTSADYREYALQKASRMGLNPTFVDKLFKIESGYDPHAKSDSGSTGVGQLIKSTARHYGLEVSKNKDERLNPIMNIDASLAHMADLNKKYNGDEQLMAVAYNQGEPTLDSHLRKNGGKLVPEKLQQDIAANLTAANANKKPKDQLTDAQIAVRAAEPVNYLNKLNNTAIPNEASLSKGKSVVPPTQAVDSSIPTNYKQEQIAENAAQQAAQDTNVGFLDRAKRGVRNFVGNLETGVSAFGSATTYPTAAIAAAMKNPKGAKDAAQGLATPEATAYYKLMDDLRNQATYAPRTPEGQAQLEQLNKTMSGLPPYMGTMVGAKPTQLRTTAAPKTVTKPGLPALVESPAAKAAQAGEQLPLFPELETAPAAAPATGKPPFAQGAQMDLPFNQPSNLPSEVANVRPGVESGAVSENVPKTLAPMQGELFPETTGGKAYPIDPEAAGIAAVQRARLAKERAAAEAAQAEPIKPIEEAVKPVEETPSAMTPEEMLDRARNYDSDQQKATIIRNRQTATEAGLPGLVDSANPNAQTSTASTDYRPPFMPNAMTMGSTNVDTPSPEELEKETGNSSEELKKQANNMGMDLNSFLLRFGLGMMAGKSPHALVNVGEAGLGALQMASAEKKAAAEQAYHEALAEQARAHAAYYPGLLAQKMAALNAKQRSEVEADTARLMASYKSNPMYATNPAALQQMEMSIREGVMNRILGQNQPAAGAAPVTVPQGVTVRQTG